METPTFKKFVSLLLLLAMVAVAIHGALDRAHTAPESASTILKPALSKSVLSTPHSTPCAPSGHHTDADGCDSCVNCSCHAPLLSQQPLLSYAPLVSPLSFSIPYQYLPKYFQQSSSPRKTTPDYRNGCSAPHFRIRRINSRRPTASITAVPF